MKSKTRDTHLEAIKLQIRRELKSIIPSKSYFSKPPTKSKPHTSTPLQQQQPNTKTHNQDKKLETLTNLAPKRGLSPSKSLFLLQQTLKQKKHYSESGLSPSPSTKHYQHRHYKERVHPDELNLRLQCPRYHHTPTPTPPQPLLRPTIRLF